MNNFSVWLSVPWNSSPPHFHVYMPFSNSVLQNCTPTPFSEVVSAKHIMLHITTVRRLSHTKCREQISIGHFCPSQETTVCPNGFSFLHDAYSSALDSSQVCWGSLEADEKGQKHQEPRKARQKKLLSLHKERRVGFKTGFSGSSSAIFSVFWFGYELFKAVRSNETELVKRQPLLRHQLFIRLPLIYQTGKPDPKEASLVCAILQRCQSGA